MPERNNKACEHQLVFGDGRGDQDTDRRSIMFFVVGVGLDWGRFQGLLSTSADSSEHGSTSIEFSAQPALWLKLH